MLLHGGGGFEHNPCAPSVGCAANSPLKDRGEELLAGWC